MFVDTGGILGSLGAFARNGVWVHGAASTVGSLHHHGPGMFGRYLFTFSTSQARSKVRVLMPASGASDMTSFADFGPSASTSFSQSTAAFRATGSGPGRS